MQEVKKEKIGDIIALLEKVYDNRIQINKIDEMKYEIELEGQKRMVSDYQDFQILLKQYFDLRNLKTKKEIYDQLLKLSQLYLKDAKEKRAILKETIPSVDIIVSSFFDVSKYCSNEHIFDDFCMKNMTYDQLLVLFPKMLSNLKQKKKEEKQTFLKTIFDDCKTMEEALSKIEFLKKNEKAYQKELQMIYPNYQDFFDYYQFSKKALSKEHVIIPINYESFYHLFLMKTIELKEKEIAKEQTEYNTLLKPYQNLKKQIRILEVQQEFEDIKNRETGLLQEKEKTSKEKKNENQKYLEKENELSKINQEKSHLLEKNIFFRFVKKKEIKELEEAFLSLKSKQEQIEKQLHFLNEQEKRLNAGLYNNEEKLKQLCGFDISIKEYEEKRNQYLHEHLTLDKLQEEASHLEAALMKYHIEKKEEELLQIYQKNQLSLPKEYKQR